MREIYTDEQKRAATMIAEEAGAHFITSREEYLETDPSIWDSDQDIVFNVPVDVPILTDEQERTEREEISVFRKRERRELRESKHPERSANHIIDKGIRAEKNAVRRDIRELSRMENQDRFARFEEKIKERL